MLFRSSGNEEAVISPDGTKIEVAGAKGKYLMVQNSTGVYAMKIDFNKIGRASCRERV